MRRREFVAALGTAAAWPLAARAQQAKSLHLGIVAFTPRTAPHWGGFEQRLRELGHIDGQNLLITFVSVRQSDAIPAAIQELRARRRRPRSWDCLAGRMRQVRSDRNYTVRRQRSAGVCDRARHTYSRPTRQRLRSNSPTNFHERCAVMPANAHCPETTIIATGRVNLDDIRHCDLAVANIQQIAGEENRWLDDLGPDFFDLILVDEAHHNTAASWQQVKGRFPNARIVNFSATPTRADGQLMEGEIIYSFPVLRAIEAGYVKRLRAKMLRPSELRYVDRSDGGERTIGPDEVRALGEADAEFRRGIVMSDETLGSIVDQSITELRRLRQEAGDQRLKIIASSLNFDHCIQITEAFRARGMRAAYVHSREAQANERVFQQLENHELDAIVQARMLGEGFDHPHLAVAMVGSIFANLSPFVQFVGRIMRAIVQNAPGHRRDISCRCERGSTLGRLPTVQPR